MCPLLCSRFPRGKPGVQEHQLLLGYHLPTPTGSRTALEQEPSKWHKSASALSSWMEVQDELRQEGFCASSFSLHTIPAAVRTKLFLDQSDKALKKLRNSFEKPSNFPSFHEAKKLITYLYGKWRMLSN